MLPHSYMSPMLHVIPLSIAIVADKNTMGFTRGSTDKLILLKYEGEQKCRHR